MESQRRTDRKLVFLALAALVLLPVVTMAVAVPMMGPGHGMGWRSGMMGEHGGYGMVPLWSVLTILVWISVLGGGGYLLYRLLSGPGTTTSDPAIEALRVEYARGNISEEDYEERRTKLREE
jgi:putative membrane protein